MYLHAQSFSRVWLFATPWTWPSRRLCPWDCPVKNTEWFPISFSRRSSWSSDWSCLLRVFCISRQILYHCATWETTIPHLILAKWLRKVLNRMGKNLSCLAPKWYLIDGKGLKDRGLCWKLLTSQVYMIRNIQYSYWSFNNLHPAVLPRMSFRKGHCDHGQWGLEFKPQ